MGGKGSGGSHKRAITEQEHEFIKSSAEAGKTLDFIQGGLKMRRTNLIKYMHAHGIKPGIAQRLKRRDDEFNRLVQNKLTWAQISEEIATPLATLRARKHKLRLATPRRKPKDAPYETLHREWRSLRRQGARIKDIANRYNVSAAVVSMGIYRLNKREAESL